MQKFVPAKGHRLVAENVGPFQKTQKDLLMYVKL